MFTNAMIGLSALSAVSMMQGGFSPYLAFKGAGYVVLFIMMIKSIFNQVIETIMPHLHELDAYELFRVVYVYWW